MVKNNTFGTILGSVFITLLLVGVGGYFGLPLLYPNLNEDLGDEGILLQTKYLEVQTTAYINDDELVEEKMPDTELNITTTGNSKLNVAFDGIFILHLDGAFSGTTRYNITLDISGVRNRTTRISYLSSSGLGTLTEETYNTHISFETGILPAGTYSISIYWKSIIAPTTGSSQLIVSSGGAFTYPRSIYVQEIAG